QVVVAGNNYVVFIKGAGLELKRLPNVRVVQLDHDATIHAWNGTHFLATRFANPNTVVAELLDANGGIVAGLVVDQSRTLRAARSCGGFDLAVNGSEGIHLLQIESHGKIGRVIQLDN